MKKIILLMLMASTSLGSLFGQEYTERVYAFTYAGSSGTPDTSFYNYDSQGRVSEFVQPDSRVGVEYTGNQKQELFYQDRDTNVKDRVAWLPVDYKEVKVFDVNNQLIEFEVFGGYGNPISKQIQKSEIIYENSKRSYVVKANRNNIFVSKYEYNPIGDLTSVTDFKLNDSVKSQKYIDGLSDKDTLIFDIEIETNKSSRTVFTYNSNGWLEKEQDQNYNNMSWTNSDTTTYQYDVNGNNVRRKTRWGETFYTFDVNVNSSTINYEIYELFNEDDLPNRIEPNKILAESYYEDGALESSTTYLYESIVPDNQVVEEKIEQLVRVEATSENRVSNFTYDEQGRVTSYTTEFDDGEERSSFKQIVTYSTTENKVTLQTNILFNGVLVPFDDYINRWFDDQNRIIKVSEEQDGEFSYIIFYDYEGENLVKEGIIRGSISDYSGMDFSEYTYDAQGRRMSSSAYTGDSLQNREVIDDYSKLDDVLEQIKNGGASESVIVYHYSGDLLDSLVQGEGTFKKTVRYGYDEVDNLVKINNHYDFDYKYENTTKSTTVLTPWSTYYFDYSYWKPYIGDDASLLISLAPNFKLLEQKESLDGVLNNTVSFFYGPISQGLSQTIIFPLSTEAVLSNGDKGQLLSAFAQDKDNVKTNLPITYEIVSGQEVGFIRNDSLVYTGVTGIVKIKAIQVGNDSYGATEKVIEVEVKQFDNLQTQFLIFSTLETGILEFDFGQKMSAFTENNQGTNTGLPVIYELVSGDDIAFIRNDSLIYKGVVGDVVIKASQVGDDTYAAVSKEQTVAVKKFEIVHNSPLCQNELLSCKPTTINNVVYEWVKPGGRKIRKQEFTIYPIKQADSGLYVLNVIRARDTLTFEVEVDVKLPAEEVFMQTLETGECEDKKYEFNVLGKYKTFEWYLNNTLIDTTVVPNLIPSFTGIYHVVAEDSNSCTSQSSSFYLDLTPDSLPIIRYDLATNSLEVTNSETYQWYVNELFIVDQTSRQLPLLVNGEYQVTTTNKEGCVFISTPFTVSENSLSNVKLNRGVVDLSDYEIVEDLVVSPNPASDRIVVSLRHPQKGNNFEVYNGEGNKVSTVTIDNNNLVQEMDVSILPKGLYVLRLFNGKSVYKKRFVVK